MASADRERGEQQSVVREVRRVSLEETQADRVADRDVLCAGGISAPAAFRIGKRNPPWTVRIAEVARKPEMAAPQTQQLTGAGHAQPTGNKRRQHFQPDARAKAPPLPGCASGKQRTTNAERRTVRNFRHREVRLPRGLAFEV